MPFQRNGAFNGMAHAYRKAKIKLIKINRETLKQIKSRDKKTIEAILRKL